MSPSSGATASSGLVVSSAAAVASSNRAASHRMFQEAARLPVSSPLVFSTLFSPEDTRGAFRILKAGPS